MVTHQTETTQNKVARQKVPVLRQYKRKRTQPSSPSNNDTCIANRFSKLPLDDDGNNSIVKIINKPPPILLYGIEDIPKLTTLLDTVASTEEYKYKIVTPHQLRISCTNVETYKKVINLIREEGL